MVKLKSNVNRLLLALAFLFSVMSNIILAVNISDDASGIVMGLVFGLMLVSATWALVSLTPESFKARLFGYQKPVLADSKLLAQEFIDKSKESKADNTAEQLKEMMVLLKEKQTDVKEKPETPKVEKADTRLSQPAFCLAETPDTEQIEEFETQARLLEEKIANMATTEPVKKPKITFSPENLERLASKQTELQCKDCSHFKKCVFVMRNNQREAIPNDQGTPSCALDGDNVIFMTEHGSWLHHLDNSLGFYCPGTCAKFEKRGTDSKHKGEVNNPEANL